MKWTHCRTCGDALTEAQGQELGYCSGTCARAVAAADPGGAEGELRKLSALERIATALERALKLHEQPEAAEPAPDDVFAALERVAMALERGLKLQEKMVELQERTLVASEAMVASTAPPDGECEWCEGGCVQVIPRKGSMPVPMTCGYCRGSGKADG